MNAILTMHSAKKATNLSVNEVLLHKAKSLKINLSALLEEALVTAVVAKEQEQWLAENQKAIEAYNQRIEAQGVFSDGLRSF
jgi:antitoxin CcdA